MPSGWLPTMIAGVLWLPLEFPDVGSPKLTANVCSSFHFFPFYACRTPGTGLYDNLQKYKIPEPTAIFDLDYFWYDPRPFFCLAKSLYPGNYQPNYVHYFIKMLHDKGLLLRMYTHNIDVLERCKPAWNRTLVQSNVGEFFVSTPVHVFAL